MAYYTGLLAFIGILYMCTGNAINKRRGRIMFFALTCTAVILFQGFRSFTVGTDLASYIPSYFSIGRLRSGKLNYLNYEAGYVLLNKLLYQLGFDERGFLIAVAGIVQIPIFYTIYRYSKRAMIPILWYFAFGNFIMTFSGLRQSIAMSLCFAAYRFIKEKHMIHYFVAILLAACFHKSALFCLALYPIYYIKLDKKNLFGAIIVFCIVFTMRNQIFTYFSTLYYGEAKATTTTGAYTMFAAYLLFFILSFYNRSPDADYMGLRNILFVLTLIYSFAPLHDYVARIGYPLTLYVGLLLPQVIDGFHIKPQGVYHGLCCIFLIICFYYFLGGLNTLPFSFG